MNKDMKVSEILDQLCFTKTFKQKSITKVNTEKSTEIIEKREILGLFYTIENDIYVGIDNSSGDAWTEDFKSLASCKRWLLK